MREYARACHHPRVALVLMDDHVCSETRAFARRMEEDKERADEEERAKIARKQAEKLKVAAELQLQMAERNKRSMSAGVSEYVGWLTQPLVMWQQAPGHRFLTSNVVVCGRALPVSRSS